MGNHVLLHNHPEGRNKIQDHYKPDVYIVFGHHQEEPNVYYIQLLNSSKPGQPKVVNRCQLYDLKRSVPPSVSSLDDDGFASIHHSSAGNIIRLTLAIMLICIFHIITAPILNTRHLPLLIWWWWRQ